MASSNKRPNPPIEFLDGGDDLMVMVAAEPVEEDVKDRDLPEPPDEEMLADGIPHLVDAYYRDMELWEKWQRQGWWPRPVKVWKWKVVVLHRPTNKHFESDPFDTKREATRMAMAAIPKVLAHRRPRWLKPANPNEYKGHRRTASAKRVASRKTAQWKPLFDGKGKKYITDDLRVYVSPEDVWETVRDRDVPDLHEVADPEMLADGIPELMDAYENAERDHAKWVRQGWWPRLENVQKWRIYVTHRPTKKNFESKGLYDSEREALRMADIAIPKIQARRRPRWLVPDSDNEAATMRSAKKTKRKDRTTEIREKKDKSKVKVKFTPGGGRNPHAEDALSRKPTRGHKRKERARAVGKGHSRKQKHKGQRAYASAARVATMFMLKDKE